VSQPSMNLPGCAWQHPLLPRVAYIRRVF
jgi:hypothetical protein